MHIVDYILNLAGSMGQWSYVLVFIVIVLECQALLGLFMPGESLVLMSGFLAGQHVFDLDAIIVTISVAAIVGDSVGFELGKHFGRDWLCRHGRRLGVREAQLQKAEAFFHRHGGMSVFFSHFTHVLRALTPFTAGASRMRYSRFLPYNTIGCVLWAGTFTMLGYFFGQNWKMLEKWIGRGGAVVGALLLLMIGMVWLWQWLARHETELRERWKAFVEQPRIAAIRRRFEPQIRFLQERLTPEGYLGLHLTVGAVIILLSCWWFGGIVQDLLARDPLVVVDQRVAIWFNEHATPGITQAARIVTFLGSPAFLVGVSVALAAFFVWRRTWYRLLALVLSMGGGALLILALKTLFHRQRPVLEHPLITLASYSFPSGHAMGATLFYLFLAFTIIMSVKQWRWQVLIILVAVMLVFFIGFTRIYLGAHYLSDVMGAMAAGLAWLAFCLTAVETLRRYRHESS